MDCKVIVISRIWQDQQPALSPKAQLLFGGFSA